MLLRDSRSGPARPFSDTARDGRAVCLASPLRGYVEVVAEGSSVSWPDGVDQARGLFPATADRAYFNTAAVGLASRPMSQRLHQLVDEWTSMGFDFSGGERDADEARSMVARLIGASAADVALISCPARLRRPPGAIPQWRD